MIEMLLDGGSRVHHQDRNGYTALHVVIQQGMKAFGDFSVLGFQSNEHSKLKVCIENYHVRASQSFN
jgi:hypothetical protein